MTALIATIRKELLLLLRDIHGLLLLFVMPVAFILIMSLALQGQFAERSGARLAVLVVDDSHSLASAAVLTTLQRNEAFDWLLVPPEAHTDAAAAERARAVARDEAAFLLRLSNGEDSLLADITVAPATSAQTEALFTAAVREALGRERIVDLVNYLDPDTDPDSLLDARTVSVQHSYAQGGGAAPSSVQQSVPAWLVFAMFFAVVPLSNALISERQQGTLRRLRTLPVPAALPVAGKLIPYFCINQLQVLLMLLVGVYLVPLCGGDRLTLGNAPAALALVSASISLAALGYGILIAVLARTTDQATTLGGTGNIILAALGGVMVPRFLMPEAMQQLSLLSPMAWGLEGLLDIFLRDGSMADVLPEAARLGGFGLVTMGLAMWLARRQRL